MNELKAASLKELKQELSTLHPDKLTEMLLRLGRFKKENKELLTYLLLYANDEERYVAEIKESLHVLFTEVNVKAFYITKKNLRKILRLISRYIKYSNEATTEIELLLFFSAELNGLGLPLARNTTLQKIQLGVLRRIEKGIGSLHEDLQYDYNKKLNALREADDE